MLETILLSYFLIILFICILCGVVSQLIAEKKGRKGWFWVGFLFGPIGVLVALIASDSKEGISAREIESGTSKKCPYCAEIIKAEAKVCRYCGHKINKSANKRKPKMPTVEELEQAIIDEDENKVIQIIETNPALVKSKNANGEDVLTVVERVNNEAIYNIIVNAKYNYSSGE